MTELDRTLALYRQIERRIPRAITNSHTFQDGYPTGAGGRGGSDSEGGRTSLLAERHIDDGDRHGDDRRALERCITNLADLVDKLAPSNAAADHLATQASDACPPGHCESCFRDAGHRERSRTPGSRMCRWCSDTARSLDTEMPDLQLVRTYHMRGRITTADVRAATRGRHG